MYILVHIGLVVFTVILGKIVLRSLFQIIKVSINGYMGDQVLMLTAFAFVILKERLNISEVTLSASA